MSPTAILLNNQNCNPELLIFASCLLLIAKGHLSQVTFLKTLIAMDIINPHGKRYRKVRQWPDSKGPLFAWSVCLTPYITDIILLCIVSLYTISITFTTIFLF